MKRTMLVAIVAATLLGLSLTAIATQPQWLFGAPTAPAEELPPEAKIGETETDVRVDLSYTGAADLSAHADELGNIRLMDLPWFESGTAPPYATPGAKSLVAAFEPLGYRVLFAETIIRHDGLAHDRAAFVSADGTALRVTSRPLDGQPATVQSDLTVERLADGSDVAVRESHRTITWVQLVKNDRQVILYTFPTDASGIKTSSSGIVDLARAAIEGY